MEARYYAPSLGRFLSRDPIGFAGGINLYAYCGGDPVNYRDPEGLDFSVGPSDHPWLAFNEDDTLNGLAVGCQAVRYVFTGTLWKPDSRFAASPYYGSSVVLSWVGLGLATAYGAWRFAPVLAGPSTVAMSSTSAASNPEGDAQGINIYENLCNILQELKVKYNGNLALGLSKHLDEFAKSHNYATFETWSQEPLMQTQEGIKILMDNASQIHFNPEGFEPDVFWDYLENGDYSTLSSNWEMKTILDNQDLFNKLTFK